MRSSSVMAWFLLACAILTEIAATTALKYTNGLNIFTHTFLTLMVVGLYITSYVCMAQALKLQLEVSVAYAMWSGIGTAAIAVIGAMFFRESIHPMKIGAIALIVVGVAMLNLGPDAGAAHATVIRPSVNIANMPWSEAMTGATAAGGRHRAPVGAAYPAARAADPYGDSYADPYGDGYAEPRRARHARPAWGRPAEPVTMFHDDHLAETAPTGHVPHQRVAGHFAGHVSVHDVTGTHVAGGYAVAADASGRRRLEADAPGYATESVIPRPYVSEGVDPRPYVSEGTVPRPYVSENDIPVHWVPAYGAPDPVHDAPAPVAAPVPAPTPPHAHTTARQAAYLGTDDVSDFVTDLDAALNAGHDTYRDDHHEADVVVEPAAVEPPAAIEWRPAPITRIPAQRRAPIKGVTLLHPYPDRPAARTPRSA
ncbi:multidrug efflux SMR transporter [Thermopolyspora sp. NPDC052614]|uniref:DMT family transporter n=1 Tax=Thermopolyspora sp. NPDC052614 TaxID=3155682 RepID=UPI003447EEBE